MRGPYLHQALPLGGAPGVAGDGTASLPVPVPNDLSLIGLRLNSQGGVLGPAAQERIALTGALETWVL